MSILYIYIYIYIASKFFLTITIFFPAGHKIKKGFWLFFLSIYLTRMKLCDACSTILNLNGINNSSIRIITVYFYCGCLSRNEWSQAALLWLAQILLVVMPTKHNHVNRFYDYKLEQVSHLQPHPLVLAFDCTPSLFLVTHLLLTVHCCSLVARHFPNVICQSN